MLLIMNISTFTIIHNGRLSEGESIHGWDRMNQDFVLQKVWHDKEPPILKPVYAPSCMSINIGPIPTFYDRMTTDLQLVYAEQRSDICSPLQATVTTIQKWNILE